MYDKSTSTNTLPFQWMMVSCLIVECDRVTGCSKGAITSCTVDEYHLYVHNTHMLNSITYQNIEHKHENVLNNIFFPFNQSLILSKGI